MKNLTKTTRPLAKTIYIALCGSGLAAVAAGAAVPLEASVKQLLLERAYERSVETHLVQKPWASADMATVGKINHPRLKQSAIILSDGTIEAMRAGPTLLPGSAKIGEAGTSVIAAHRDTHFAFLKDVRVGDRIEAAGTDGKMANYRVMQMEIVEADAFTIPKGLQENALALSTCYPFSSVRGGTKRYVVHAILDNG